jgi:uncharacterized protein
MQFSCKVHRESGEMILAVSDSDILGKRFEEGELVLEASKDFYHEEQCSEHRLRELVHEATMVNAVGEKVVRILIEEKLIDKGNVLRIGGVPHAQAVRI